MVLLVLGMVLVILIDISHSINFAFIIGINVVVDIIIMMFVMLDIIITMMLAMMLGVLPVMMVVVLLMRHPHLRSALRFSGANSVPRPTASIEWHVAASAAACRAGWRKCAIDECWRESAQKAKAWLRSQERRWNWLWTAGLGGA